MCSDVIVVCVIIGDSKCVDSTQRQMDTETERLDFRVGNIDDADRSNDDIGMRLLLALNGGSDSVVTMIVNGNERDLYSECISLFRVIARIMP